MTITKLKPYLFEVKKSGKMKVPVRIYASEKLMKNIEEDRCVQQGINVAMLPGIYKHSIMLPDTHQGYGFPIGGVAAIDAETGCISPGGIGFDINCLTEDSHILTGYGSHKSIQEFERDFVEVDNPNSEYVLKSQKARVSLISLDKEKLSFTSKNPAYIMKKRHSGYVLELETRLGNRIRVTEDHPILTKEGMLPAKELGIGKEIAVFPFKGMPHEEFAEDRILVEENIFFGQQKTHLQKRNLLPFNLKHEKLPIIARLLGYLLGDGLVYFSGKKGFICAYGPEEDLKNIQRDFAELGFSARIYSRKRNHRIPTRYGLVEFSSNNYELHVSSRALAKLLVELGYTEGN